MSRAKKPRWVVYLSKNKTVVISADSEYEARERAEKKLGTLWMADYAIPVDEE